MLSFRGRYETIHATLSIALRNNLRQNSDDSFICEL